MINISDLLNSLEKEKLQYKYITPEQQLALDPTGKITDALLGTTTSSVGAPNRFLTIPAIDVIDSFVCKFRKFRFPASLVPYQEYWEEMLLKCGPQGGHRPITELIPVLAGYYKIPSQICIPSKVIQARDYLIQRIKDVRWLKEPPVIGYDLLIRGTAASIPTAMRKGDFLAETVAMTPGRHVLPNVPGMRFQRGKLRGIFQDANANVRLIEPILRAARDWLKSNFPEYFGSWLHPDAVIRPYMTAVLRNGWYSVEEDYKAMDQHFTNLIAQELIVPVYEAIFGASLPYFAAIVEELFNQELFLGRVMITGEHTLFSGQAITNDFETVLSIILQLAAVMSEGVSALHLALGDDSNILVPTEADAHKVHEKFIDYAHQCGFECHDDGVKNRISKTPRYLRVTYSAGSPKNARSEVMGNYPSILALNNIVFPENQLPTASQQVAADLQRMDNVYAQPDYVLFRQHVVKYYPQLTEVDPADDLPRDWWARLYGESWNPAKSPTFCDIYGLPIPTPKLVDMVEGIGKNDTLAVVSRFGNTKDQLSIR